MSSNCFSIIDVPLGNMYGNNTYCVYCDNNTHLDLQIAQTSALIEVFTVIFKSSVFDYQHLPAILPLNS